MRGKPDTALAARLREIKDHCQVSYQRLGVAIGVNNATVFRYLNGTIRIPADRLSLIARAFGCDVRYLHMPFGSPLPTPWWLRPKIGRGV